MARTKKASASTTAEKTVKAVAETVKNETVTAEPVKEEAPKAKTAKAEITKKPAAKKTAAKPAKKAVNSNVYVVTNYPIMENIHKTKLRSDLTTLCFAGGIRSDWNHEVILKAIKDIENIKYVVAGNCTNDYLNILKQYESFDKMEFLGKINHCEVKELYAKSTIGMALCSYRPNTEYKMGSLGNTKIFEYMMSELPVIFTDFEVFKNILTEGVYGIAVNPYSEEDVKNAIKYLIDNPDIALKMGKTGRKLVEKKYNWESQVPILLSVYEKLGRQNEK